MQRSKSEFNWVALKDDEVVHRFLTAAEISESSVAVVERLCDFALETTRRFDVVGILNLSVAPAILCDRLRCVAEIRRCSTTNPIILGVAIQSKNRIGLSLAFGLCDVYTSFSDVDRLKQVKNKRATNFAWRPPKRTSNWLDNLPWG